MSTIFIDHEPVELYKILKFECLVDGGGEAKAAINNGYISVNEEITTQKRKKIYAGDVIGFNGQNYQIALQAKEEVTQKTSPAEKPVNEVKPKKRSAIKF